MKNLKLWFCLLCVLGFPKMSAFAQQSTSKQLFLDEGDKVEMYPKVDWLKGEPITHFDKHKIYIVELWATWCVPCLLAMPHISDLNHKFKDKNVVFIAQDIMEEDKAKVETLVQQRSSVFNFPVAYGGGAQSDFSVKWVAAAGIRSIPQTLVIQNNTLVWITRPNMLNEQIIQLLIDGKFSVEAAEKLVKKD